MSSTIDEDIARVTVISPNRRVDLALPGQVTLGEVLPSIVKFAGLEANSVSDAVHTWVLQKFGEDPLDTNQLVSSLQLNDGETLHLRRREDAMPDAAFDDVIDAVATSTERRPSWEPKHSQRIALAAIITVLLGFPLALLFRPFEASTLHVWAGLLAPGGRQALVAACAAAVLAFACTIAAVSVSRAAGEYRVASAFAWTAVALAGLAGFGVLPGSTPAPLKLTIAAAAVLLVAATCAMGAGVQVMSLLTAAVTAALVLAACAAMVVMPAKIIEISAVTVAVMVGLTSMLPTWSYRIARIALPAVPPDAEAMMADETPVQSDIVSRALLADRLIAAFLVATSMVVTLFTLPLLLHRSWWTIALVVAVSLALALRARSFVGLQQRLALLLAGGLGLFGALVFALPKLSPTWQGLVVGIVTLVSVLLLSVFATSMYQTIIAPTWGRAGDVLEWLSIMTMVPLLLGVLDLYVKFRSIGG